MCVCMYVYMYIYIYRRRHSVETYLWKKNVYSTMITLEKQTNWHTNLTFLPKIHTKSLSGPI